MSRTVGNSNQKQQNKMCLEKHHISLYHLGQTIQEWTK